MCNTVIKVSMSCPNQKKSDYCFRQNKTRHGWVCVVPGMCPSILVPIVTGLVPFEMSLHACLMSSLSFFFFLFLGQSHSIGSLWPGLEDAGLACKAIECFPRKARHWSATVMQQTFLVPLALYLVGLGSKAKPLPDQAMSTHDCGLTTCALQAGSWTNQK